MSRTARAREHLLTLYRSGTASEQELADAVAAYDEAAIAEGVQAVVDATPPLTPEQRHTLAVLLAARPRAPRPDAARQRLHHPAQRSAPI